MSEISLDKFILSANDLVNLIDSIMSLISYTHHVKRIEKRFCKKLYFYLLAMSMSFWICELEGFFFYSLKQSLKKIATL